MLEERLFSSEKSWVSNFVIRGRPRIIDMFSCDIHQFGKVGVDVGINIRINVTVTLVLDGCIHQLDR